MLPPNFPAQAVHTAIHEQRHRDRYLTRNHRNQDRPRRVLQIRINITALRRIFRLFQTAESRRA